MLESSSGNIKPTDLEEMTIDQALICLLPAKALTSISKVSPEAAAAMGLIPAGKSRVQEIREQKAAEEAAKRASQAKRQRRRRERRRRKE